MKNIILLITDTFRYDNLGDRAKRPVKTPELDAFAAQRATEIEGFYTGSFPTIPHRTDVATGRLGWPRYPWQPIDLSGRNHIARGLARDGYATQLLCDCPHLFNARFNQGFQAAYQHRGQEGDRHLLHLNDDITEVMPAAKTRATPSFQGRTLADMHRWINRYASREDEMFCAKTAATAVQWLEENHLAAPFFLWVDFFDPHEPWDPPEYLVRKYDPDYGGEPMLHCNYGPATDYSPDELNNLWAHYAAETELVDRHLGRILQKIDDLALWDDSIVVVTSDHGTSLGEHNRTGKSNICDHDERYWPIYPEVGHVPFLIAGGDVPRGKSLDMLAQPVDIQPTLSDLAGAALEPPEAFEGRSFAQALLASRPDHRDLAVTGTFVRPGDDGRLPAKCVTPWVTDGRWGLAPVGASGAPELYDVVADPFAENDVAGINADVVKGLCDGLAAHLAQHDAPQKLIDSLAEES
ncbi:MAG: sulfatase [Gammaproteobacteria bacterium]|nr:sulfatase [Gammaproteobacteria bacterium]